MVQAAGVGDGRNDAGDEAWRRRCSGLRGLGETASERARQAARSHQRDSRSVLDLHGEQQEDGSELSNGYGGDALGRTWQQR